MVVILGIDLGTTAIKCVLVDQETTQILAQSSVSLAAEERKVFSTTCASRQGVQLVSTVLIGLRHAIQQLGPEQMLARIDRIGICGQMHGIVWWHSMSVVHQAETLLESSSDALQQITKQPAWSDLITWEDQRCSQPFLQQCRHKIQARIGLEDAHDSRRCSPLATGYGLATFAHQVQYKTMDLATFDCCGTIMDFVAFVLGGKTKPDEAAIDTTNAFSWGCFDLVRGDWNVASIDALDIPLSLLPRVRASDARFGTVQSGWFGLPLHATIGMGTGDHPCAVHAALVQLKQQQQEQGIETANVTLVNVGTSAQLAMVFDHQPVRDSSSTSSFELRPFFQNRFLGVAASLSGGNMIAAFVANCQTWRNQLTIRTADETSLPSSNDENVDETALLYEHLIRLGLAKKDTLVTMHPTFMGERSDPDARASVGQLTLENCSLGDLFAALCKGLIENLMSMVPASLQAQMRDQKMIGTGNALVRNALLQHFLTKKLRDECLLTLQSSTDAAFGAALVQSWRDHALD